MTRIPFAVVGCGYWGAKHIRVAYQNPLVEVAMAADAREDRLRYVASQYPGIPVTHDFGSVLASDAVGVILATPISTHYGLAKEALLAGKHVLIEKPMATSAEHCRELISIAEQRGLVLMTGHTFEYHPGVTLIRDLVKQGRIGQPYYASSRRLNLGLYQHDANVLWDLAPHDLSIIRCVLDAEIKSITAWGCSHILPRTEDVVYAKMELSNGATGYMHVSWLEPVKVRQLSVVGSEGMLVFDDVSLQEKVRIYEKRFKPQATGDSFADFQSAYRQGNVFIPEVPAGEPLELEIIDFAQAIRTGTQPRADGWSGLRVVQALETAASSLRQASQRMRSEHDVYRHLMSDGAQMEAH